MSILPLSAAISLDNSQIAVSRINSKNGEEFVEIYNFSPRPIAIANLDIKAYRNADPDAKPNSTSKSFNNQTLVGNGFILIKQGGTASNSDASYGATVNNITKDGGIVKVSLDSIPTYEICWGDVDCENRINISDNSIFTTDRCSADLICASSEKRFGGLTDIAICQFNPLFLANDENCVDPNPAEPCEFNQGILANDPLCIEPADPEDPDDPPITPPEPETNNCAKLMITEISANVDEADKFIEIFNPTDMPLNLTGCQIVTYNESGNPPSGSKTFIFGDEILDAGQYRAIKIADTPLKLNKTTGGTVCVVSIDGQIEEPCVTYGKLKANSAWALIGDNWQETFILTPGALNPEPLPLNLCAGLRVNEIGANLDDQFVEITADRDVDLTGCRLMTNRSATKYYEFGQEILLSGALKVISIADTDLTLTKTTTGTVYLIASDGVTEIDAVTYENLAKNTSWALVDSEWVQTYAITRGGVNVNQEFAACQEGYFRNLETGRCNKIVEPDVLKPCPEGQYRNPETNRCRSLTSSGTTLVPCQEGYERNPLTNRCRKIATTDDPKPCAEGYERNPETNRCRKIVSSAPAGFAVKMPPPDGNNLWQWAVGAIVALTGMVIIFQYRAEIGRFFQKLFKKTYDPNVATGVK